MYIYRVALFLTEAEVTKAKAWFKLRGVKVETERDPLQGGWAVMADEEHARLATRMWAQSRPSWAATPEEN